MGSVSRLSAMFNLVIYYCMMQINPWGTDLSSGSINNSYTSCCIFQVVASLQAQLEQRKRDAEQRDVLFQSLSQETENLKNQLATVSSKCQTLETQVVVGTNLLPQCMSG